MGIFCKVAQRMNRILVPVGCQKMVKENIGYYPRIFAITRSQQFYTLFHISMLVGKRINSSVKNDAKCHLLRKFFMPVALHKIAYKISEFDFFRTARQVYMSKIIHIYDFCLCFGRGKPTKNQSTIHYNITNC